VVALWPGAADTMHVHFGVPRDRLVVIPNGVDPARFPPIDRRDSRAARLQLGLDPDRRTVACIGALVPEKGVDLAIESVGTMADVQLLVTGAGPERASLEALAGREAPRRVVFVEPLADPTPALTAADVVVLPSRGGDSMPAVLIEAAFAGVPIVATPIEGIPEIVVADATGLLVPVGSVSELRAAIGRILETPGLAARLSAAARARCIERFTMDRVAADWDRVLGATIEAATP
jgi:glycosyltransferase involved in cell wall biosynthesis